MTRRTPSRFAVALAVAALTLAGCTIAEDSAPRVVPIAERGQFGDRPTGGAAEGTARIFLVTGSGDEQPRLRSVLRDVANEPEAILGALLDGANAVEQDSGLSSFLPAGLELLSGRVRGRLLTIDMTDAFDELTADALRFAVAQLVTTASEIDGVENVRLQVNGENQVWPLGDGQNTDRVLTAYDYPSFVESSQPAYPATPPAN